MSNIPISFFVVPPRMMKSVPRHLGRVSSIIRGYQIAEYIGARVNPESGYQDDVCIYVKPYIYPGDKFNFEGKPYLDIVDGSALIDALNRYPEVPAIVCSRHDLDTYRRKIRNRRVWIPQQHCNFERARRYRREVTTVGIIGAFTAFEVVPPEIYKGLEERKIKVIRFTSWNRREDVCDFYNSIDIQLVWRNFYGFGNPLKIVNGMSFGIPTIALEEPSFKEVRKNYFAVHTPEEWLDTFDNLRQTPGLYRDFALKGLDKAEEYHIEKIAKLYIRLLDE